MKRPRAGLRTFKRNRSEIGRLFGGVRRARDYSRLIFGTREMTRLLLASRTRRTGKRKLIRSRAARRFCSAVEAAWIPKAVHGPSVPRPAFAESHTASTICGVQERGDESAPSNPPLQRTWSSVTLGTTPLNGKVVRRPS